MSKTYTRPSRANFRRLEDLLFGNREKVEKMQLPEILAFAKKSLEFPLTLNNVKACCRAMGICPARKKRVVKKAATSAIKREPLEYLVETIVGIKERNDVLTNAVISLYKALGVELPQ